MAQAISAVKKVFTESYENLNENTALANFVKDMDEKWDCLQLDHTVFCFPLNYFVSPFVISLQCLYFVILQENWMPYRDILRVKVCQYDESYRIYIYTYVFISFKAGIAAKNQ